MEQIIIFGANGMLGRYILEVLTQNKKITYQIIPITRSKFDIMKNNISNLLGKSNPSIVINCAGIIPQRKKTDSEMLFVNAVFPNLLAQYCISHQIQFIHITTDCVYTGKTGKYRESDIHDETNLYGQSKSCGENHKGQIIRTSIIGEEQRNKVSLLEWIRSHKPGETINGFVDHYWNGVTCHQLALIIAEIIINNITWTGVKHIYSPNVMTKYCICEAVNEIYDLKLNVKKQYTDTVSKTLNSNYNLLFNIPPIKQQIINQKNFVFNY